MAHGCNIALMFQLPSEPKVEVGSEDLSVVHIPVPKKNAGVGYHSALADLAIAGDTPLLVVRHAQGDCITIPSAAIQKVWPFPDALRIDPDVRIAIELPSRAPLGALCETLAAAGIEGLVTATPGSSKASVTLRLDDFAKVAAFLPDLGLDLGATDRLTGGEVGSSVSAKEKAEFVPSHLRTSDAKAAQPTNDDGIVERDSSSSSNASRRSRSSDKKSRKKRKKSSSSSRSQSKRSRRKFKEKSRSRDKHKSKGRDKSREKGKTKEKDKKKDKSRDRHDKKSRSRDRDRDRDRDKDRDKKDKDRDKNTKDSKENGSRKSPKRSKPARGGFDKKEAQVPSTVALVASGMGLLPGMPNYTSLTADPEVEAFLAINPVDQQAAARFRALPLELQRLVLARGGSLVGTRDPSAVLMSRVRDAMSGGTTPKSTPAQQNSNHLTVAQLASNPQIEAFLAENPVDFQVAQRLRALPPHMQRVVLIRGGLSAVRDPSSVLMSRIRDAIASGGASVR